MSLRRVEQLQRGPGVGGRCHAIIVPCWPMRCAAAVGRSAGVGVRLSACERHLGNFEPLIYSLDLLYC
eukprot:COSAG05_NODE_421_length_9965_cov_60.769207_14_plen_68_part_00